MPRLRLANGHARWAVPAENRTGAGRPFARDGAVTSAASRGREKGRPLMFGRERKEGEKRVRERKGSALDVWYFVDRIQKHETRIRRNINGFQSHFEAKSVYCAFRRF